jgi:hypothetical protein
MALSDRRVSCEASVSYLQRTINLIIDELSSKDSSILLLQKRIATLEKKLRLYELETGSINYYLAKESRISAPD